MAQRRRAVAPLKVRSFGYSSMTHTDIITNIVLLIAIRIIINIIVIIITTIALPTKPKFSEPYRIKSSKADIVSEQGFANFSINKTLK